jgi:metallo-beta-lactamase family protein
MAKVISYGAAGTVTGSCHLLKIDQINILIDCGMFQGEDEDLNSLEFEFNPEQINFLILTHAHIDHIGRVPKLVKDGFNGVVISTVATFEIAEIMLLDAAYIAEEEYATKFKKAQRIGDEQSIKEPIYTKSDVEAFFEKKLVKLDYHQVYNLTNEISLEFFDAGHILGSAFVKLKFLEENFHKSVVFSGDIGSKDRLILDSLEYIKEADTLFIESTYGDRVHKSLQKSIEEFKEVIKKTINNDGNVIIPSFALERTQEILWLLKDMYEKKELPQCKIFLDSPLAIKATRIYEKFPVHFNEKIELSSTYESPFEFAWLSYTQKKFESMEINNVSKRAIIIAGSGMCSGGRILHHLKQRLWNKNNTIIFVGFQAFGTLGRQIVDGLDFVKIYGENIIVKAKICTINGFSAHGDRDDLLEWMRSFERLSKVFLIHGEEEKMEYFKQDIHEKFGINAHIMKRKESVYI